MYLIPPNLKLTFAVDALRPVQNIVGVSTRSLKVCPNPVGPTSFLPRAISFRLPIWAVYVGHQDTALSTSSCTAFRIRLHGISSPGRSVESLAFCCVQPPTPLPLYTPWAMSSYNSTVSDFRAVEINMQALSIIQDSTMNAGDTMVEIALLSLLFGKYVAICVLDHCSHNIIGILTVLSFTSTYFLV